MEITEFANTLIHTLSIYNAHEFKIHNVVDTSENILTLDLEYIHDLGGVRTTRVFLPKEWPNIIVLRSLQESEIEKDAPLQIVSLKVKYPSKEKGYYKGPQLLVNILLDIHGDKDPRSLGNKTSIHRTGIAKWINGRSQPTLHNLITLSEELGVNMVDVWTQYYQILKEEQNEKSPNIPKSPGDCPLLQHVAEQSATGPHPRKVGPSRREQHGPGLDIRAAFDELNGQEREQPGTPELYPNIGISDWSEETITDFLSGPGKGS